MSCEEAAAQQQPEQAEEKTDDPPIEEPLSELAKGGEISPAEEPAEAVVANPEKAPVASEEDVFTYRALVLTGYGGYEKVKLQMKKGKPSIKSGEVLVRVKACGLNFAELLGRQGLYELLPSPPVTLGMECSGVIEALGEDVTSRKVGDRVLVLSRHGLWQEVVAVPASQTFIMPESMSFEEAAALPINYLTAYMMLFEMANVRAGQSILIHMAAGGVGIAATQLCQTLEGVTVFGTASASKHETISQGGVTHPVDYRTRDYAEEIRKISPKGLDVVLDPLGGSDTHKAFSLLKPMGTLIVFGAANCVTGQKKNLLAMAKTWYNQFTINTLRLMHANKAVCGFHLGYLGDDELIFKTMNTLLELYIQGKIKPRIDSTYHFEQVGDAMRRMHERNNIGKVILLPEPKAEKEVENSEEKAKSSPEQGEMDDKKEEEVKKEESSQEGVKSEEN
ncbi:synaptic vesicle membrane protein VAT-1 homolog [Esox lucius]|uniref:Enoyl reductase (ER) domain-containing protein n=1 Tax=Esox lucius TaxID=8010 RepID=A0A3P8XND5_ESOLU|nr:synaptic vesicle membrane protein VAT-1 homolog [Esox lucius]